MLVKIINGCYGSNSNGIIRPIRLGETVEVDEAEANRLVEIGVAEIVAPVEVPEEEIPFSDEPAHLCAEDLEDMPFENLKALASDMGIDVNKLRSRKKITQAIVEQEVYVSSEDEVEAPPTIEPEAPVV